VARLQDRLADWPWVAKWLGLGQYPLTSFQSATSTCRSMRAGVAQGGLVSPVLFSLYVNDIPIRSRHGVLAQFTDDTAHVATSRSPSLPVGYLEAYLGRLEHWLQVWRIVINVAKSTAVLLIKTARRIKNPGQSSFSESQYSESKQHVILEWPLIDRWPRRHTNQVGRKAAQKLGVLSPLLNRRSGLSIRNGVLLYKQLIRPMTNYVCAVWMSATRSHVRKLQVFQSKCLHIATNSHWYVRSRQIHEDLEIPYFSDHIRTRSESFDSNLADAGTPYFGNKEGTYACHGLSEITHG
jgi:hypothetical protein